MTGQTDRLEVAGRRYSQDTTLLDSDNDVELNSEKQPPLMSGNAWVDSALDGVRSLRTSLDKNLPSTPTTPPKKLLRNALIFLIPSFLSPHSTLEFKKYKPNSTEWLDGLRGIAAFFVFVYHHVVAYTGEEHDYAWDPKRHPHPIHLPILRLFYSGTPMVRVFFVISGFALTYRPVKLMRKAGSQGALMKNIASSVFRRYLRLFLPCLGAYFLIHCIRAWGAFDWFEVRHVANKNLLPGDIEKYPAKSPDGFMGQMGVMFDEFYRFAVRNPILHEGYDFATDKHMWTIPTEYQQSMGLFLLVAMVSHLRRNFRVYVVIPYIYFFWTYYKRYDYPLFVSGYFFAELHAAFETPSPLPTSQQQPSSTSQERSLRKSAKTIFWSFVAFVGLYLLSFPTRDGDDTFGYITLCRLMAKESYYTKRVAYQSFGATTLCFALLYLPRAQAYLSLPLFQYLGRVSFSLYLMHGMVIRTMGHRLVLQGWSLYPEDAYGGRMFIIVVVYLFAVLPVTMWLSDVFWRLVESPATNFVRWSEGLVIARDEKESVGHGHGQVKTA
ncbi:hypothetical protein H072_2877 [Dactylellina haptotyla CBS 200.50]|uniref:Acyltransferase 3 domain-containing protein n=1 Tax=Dactylellina haptotyla (strain CBS 200.50) TaxID=1284197 RepID=S8APV4_DACHA|nr:hypothetical protein H072_2877 [Dactylellina haptotyla CBS 200.50]